MRTPGIQDGGVTAYNMVLNLNGGDLGRMLNIWGRECLGADKGLGEPAAFRGWLIMVCHEQGQHPILTLDTGGPAYTDVYAEFT